MCSSDLLCQNPTCGAEIPLTANYWLAKKPNKKIAYRPIVDHQAKTIEFEILQGDTLQETMSQGFDPAEGTVSRANAACPVCGQVTRAKQVRQLARQGEMGERMIAVVLHHPNQTGKRYRLAMDEDRRTFRDAEVYLREKISNWPYLESPLPEETPDARDHAVNRLPMYGMYKWKDLFNLRQQLALVTFLDKIKGKLCAHR